MMLDERKLLKLLIRILGGVQRLMLLSITIILACDLGAVLAAVLAAVLLSSRMSDYLWSYQPTFWTSRLPFLPTVILYANGAILIAGALWFAVFLLRVCLSFLFCGQYSLRNLILLQMILFVLVGLVCFGNDFTKPAGLIIAFFLVLGGGLWLRDSGYWLSICPKTGELKCLSPVFGRGRDRTAPPSSIGS